MDGIIAAMYRFLLTALSLAAAMSQHAHSARIGVVMDGDEPAVPLTAERLDTAGIEVRQDVVYGELPGVDAERLSLDLYAPAQTGSEERLPIVLYLHGGDIEPALAFDDLPAWYERMERPPPRRPLRHAGGRRLLGRKQPRQHCVGAPRTPPRQRPSHSRRMRRRGSVP